MAPEIAGPRAVIFTDLDGTLLDHDTYDFSAALGALEEAGRLGVPVVLCSSKTRAEILEWQSRLGLAGPFISENGGGIFLTGGGALRDRFPEVVGGLPAVVFGAPYPLLRRALLDLRGRWGAGVRGFGDMDEGEVASVTGLSKEDAALARSRDFDEPFLWEPPPEPGDVEAARERLAPLGLSLVRGGRFWHLTGANDKGRAVRWILDAFQALWGQRPRSLALGDGENDLPMLRTVDTGVLVERPGGGHLGGHPPGVRTVRGSGPSGWGPAVSRWLREVSG